jgi:FtsP/CotA-like multicopper oxidase with cupredoxin domain
MGERYDIEVTLDEGVFPLVASAEGKAGSALALIRTGPGAPPEPDVRPRELSGAVLRYDQLRATSQAALPVRNPDREHRLELRVADHAYRWTINGQPFDQADALPVRSGERVRLTFINTTSMWHPMHLHGHTFQLAGDGPRKDTVAVLPQQSVTCDFDGDNPGQWMVHCHNVYHQESGMMRTLAYEQ